MLISRMSKNIDNTSFMERVFSKYEREYINSKANRAQTAAGLFCAKEAYLKANMLGICDMQLNKIEIRHSKEGAPFIYTDKGYRAHLSISHMGDIAVAQVIMESEE